MLDFSAFSALLREINSPEDEIATTAHFFLKFALGPADNADCSDQVVWVVFGEFGRFGRLRDIRKERAPRMVTRMTNAGGMLLGLLIVAAGATGCSTLQSSPSTDLTEQVHAEQPARGEVIVALRDGRDNREYLKAPLTDTMLVQDALKGSGALQRFKRMDVVVVRKVEGRAPLRMPAHFDSFAHRVSAATNYALHPGDVVEVTEDTSTVFDRMIDSALGTLGPITHNRR